MKHKRKCFTWLLAIIIVIYAPVLVAESLSFQIHSDHGISLRINTSTTLSVQGVKAGAGGYTYTWHSTAGNIEGSGATVTYTAPSTPTRAFVTVHIDGGDGKISTQTIGLEIFKQYVMLKADDLGASRSLSDPQVPTLWARYFNYMRNEAQVKASAGIIGQRVRNASDAFFEYILEHHLGGYIEFWNHGWEHAQYAKSWLIHRLSR